MNFWVLGIKLRALRRLDCLEKLTRQRRISKGPACGGGRKFSTTLRNIRLPVNITTERREMPMHAIYS